jgi:hypothetical protein
MNLEYEPEDEAAGEPELDESPRDLEPAPARSGGRPILWVALILALGAAGIAFWVLGPEEEPGPPPEVAALDEAKPQASPELDLGAEIDEEGPVAIPPLDESDSVVRELVRGLSSHPALADWLATDRLVRRFVVAVDNLAEGTDPRQHLPVRALEQPFATTPGGGPARIDPESYRRYDRLATLFVSLDARGAAELYTRLEPRIDEAYRDLGYPHRSFDDALVRAIRQLLATPIPEQPPIVVPRVRGWAFEDSDLEALAPAQKVLLRMGPDNARAVKNHLRRMARELGVPREALGG